MDKITALYNEMLSAYVKKDIKKALSLSNEIKKIKDEQISMLRKQYNIKATFAA